MSLWERGLGRISSAVPFNAAVRLDGSALCSFTFDDCPYSALAVAGRRLESLGARATYFIAGEPSSSRAEKDDALIWGTDLADARSAGHEIGCHTFTHRSLRLLGDTEIEAEFDRNLDAVRQILPDVDLVSFAYPFGEVSFRSKRAVARRFGVGRGTREGLNGRVVDLSELRTISLRSRSFSKDRIRRIVARAVRNKSWLVFVGHDVRKDPSAWGCTPEEFYHVADEVANAGIEIFTLKAALGRISHRVPDSPIACEIGGSGPKA